MEKSTLSLCRPFVWALVTSLLLHSCFSKDHSVKSHVVVGSVKFSDGSPAANADITICDPPDCGGTQCYVKASTTTDETGHYSIRIVRERESGVGECPEYHDYYICAEWNGYRCQACNTGFYSRPDDEVLLDRNKILHEMNFIIDTE